MHDSVSLRGWSQTRQTKADKSHGKWINDSQKDDLTIQDCTHADDIIFHPLMKPLGSNLFLLTCLSIFVFYVFICLFIYFLFGGSLAERLGRWGPFLESPDKYRAR